MFSSAKDKLAHLLGSLCPEARAAETALVGGSSGATSSMAGDGFAPKHGVRLLRRRLDLQMVLPLLLANPVTALDLEGQLDPYMPAAGVKPSGVKPTPGDGVAAETAGEDVGAASEAGNGVFGVDLLQVYVPSVDLVLLIYTPDMTPAAVARILGPWLTSAAHAKARKPSAPIPQRRSFARLFPNCIIQARPPR
jgi:hypothetical protein